MYLQVQFNYEYNILFNLKYFVYHSGALIVFLLIIYNTSMNFTLQTYFEISFVYYDHKLH